jgi:hypothetical protein
VLLFPAWLPESVARVRDIVAVPVSAVVAAFGLAMGLAAVGAEIVLAVNGTSDWRTSIAGVIAALPNVTVVALMVGLGAGLDAAGYASVLGSGPNANGSTLHVTDLGADNVAWWLLTVGALAVVAVFGLLVVRGSRTAAASRQNLLVGIAVAAVASFVGAWAASVYLTADVGIGGASAMVGVNAWLALVIGALAGGLAWVVGTLAAKTMLRGAVPPMPIPAPPTYQPPTYQPPTHQPFTYPAPPTSQPPTYPAPPQDPPPPA